jgi:beta-lactamase class A
MAAARRKPRKRPFRLVLAASFLLLAVVYLRQAETNHAFSTSEPNITTPTPTPDMTGLQTTLSQIIARHTEAKIAVSVVPQNGTPIGIDADSPWFAASVGKLVAATCFLHGVEQGTYSLDGNLGIYPTQFQLQQLVNQSNNDSWDLFNQLIGNAAEEAYAKSIGMAHYDVNENEMSTSDAATLLTKLRSGTLLTPEHTQLLMSYMQNTEEERFIPSGITNPGNLYHKIGLYDTYAHDAAIINAPSPYVLVIFTDGQGDQDYDSRATIFKEITQAVTRVLGD